MAIDESFAPENEKELGLAEKVVKKSSSKDNAAVLTNNITESPHRASEYSAAVTNKPGAKNSLELDSGTCELNSLLWSPTNSLASDCSAQTLVQSLSPSALEKKVLNPCPPPTTNAAGDHVDVEPVKGNGNVLTNDNTHPLCGATEHSAAIHSFGVNNYLAVDSGTSEPLFAFKRGGRMVPNKPSTNSLFDHGSSSRTLLEPVGSPGNSGTSLGGRPPLATSSSLVEMKSSSCLRALEAEEDSSSKRRFSGNYICSDEADFVGAAVVDISNKASVLSVEAVNRGSQIRKEEIYLQNKSALKIQSVLRGNVARLSVANMNKSAVKIQAATRGFAQRSEFLLTRASIVTMQSVARCVVAKRNFARMKTGAVKIQSQFRGMVAKKQFQTLKSATIQLQAVFRGFAQKRRFDNLVQYIALQNRSALKIQSVFRGACEKKNVATQKNAAVFVQRIVRGLNVRKEIRVMNASALKIQSVLRGNVARLSVTNMNKSAVKIQAATRGFTQRREFLLTRASIVTMQYVARCVVAKRDFTRMKTGDEEAVLIIGAPEPSREMEMVATEPVHLWKKGIGGSSCFDSNGKSKKIFADKPYDFFLDLAAHVDDTYPGTVQVPRKPQTAADRMKKLFVRKYVTGSLITAKGENPVIEVPLPVSEATCEAVDEDGEDSKYHDGDTDCSALGVENPFDDDAEETNYDGEESKHGVDGSFIYYHPRRFLPSLAVMGIHRSNGSKHLRKASIARGCSVQFGSVVLPDKFHRMHVAATSSPVQIETPSIFDYVKRFLSKFSACSGGHPHGRGSITPVGSSLASSPCTPGVPHEWSSY